MTTLFVSCSKPIEDSSKEVIVLEENVDRENKDEISLELLYKIRIYGADRYSNGQSLTETGLMMIRDKLVHLDLKMHRKLDYEIEKLTFGDIKAEKDEEGFNIVSWEDSDIKGKLLYNDLNDDEFRIIYNDKVYDLKDDLSLKEIEVYRDLNKDDIYLYKGIEDKVDLIEFDKKIQVINLEENKSFIIDDLDKITGADTFDYDKSMVEYGILGVEDERLYISLKEGPKGGDKDLKIAYIENNELKLVFDKEALEIKSNNIEGDGKNEVIISDNKIIFTGIVNEVSGIWKYDISSQELKLEMELDSKENPSIFISPNKKNIIISTSKWDKEKGGSTFGTYIVSLDEEMSFKDITNLSLTTHSSGITKGFYGFSEDSKKLYMKCYGTKEEKSEIYYEIYEIN